MPTGAGSPRSVVVVGGGLAGAKAVEALREKGFDGRLTLVGAEVHRPYERPPLSKGFLAGKADRGSLFVHTADWYAEHRVELLLGDEAVAVDRAAKQVELHEGGRLEYDKLLLATGSSPLRIGAQQRDGVFYLRTIEDSDWLRDVIATPSARLVVVGAGWIGLEVAAVAREAGLTVTVLETRDTPLRAALGPEAGRVFADLHTAHGVDLRLGTRAVSADRHNVELADGTRLEAEAVVAGIGATPNVELARAAGLTVTDGVVVDAALRSSDPDIFAVGDIASAYHPLLRRHIRVEHWSAALNQPAVAAAGMLGEPAEYDRLPYFFTDQYDLGMEFRGDIGPDGYDRVVFRGDVAGREFHAFWLRERRVLAAMNVNLWDDSTPLETLVRAAAEVDPERLADPATPLAELAVS